MNKLVYWLLGYDKKYNRIVQDDIWLVFSWRDLQTQPSELRVLPFIALLAIGLALPFTGFTTPKVNKYSVPVLTTDILAHTPLNTVDIAEKNIPHAPSSNMISSAEGLKSMESTRPIRANTPILRHMVQPIPTVRKNAHVRIKYAVAGIELSALGRALANGAKGDVVKIQNIDSNTIVMGQIVNATTVVIR